MSCSNCLQNPCDCCCKTTTTTTCRPPLPPPCTDVCDEITYPECIIYNGEDLDCYGIKKGDNVKDILNIIFEKLNVLDCNCDFNSVITQVYYPDPTTTTSTTSTTTLAPTTTTSTTTLPVANSICFKYSENTSGLECPDYIDFITINSGAIVDGKLSYSFEFEGVDYIIKWSSAEERWELYDVTVPASPVLVATLSQDTQYPLGSLKTSWVFEDGYEGLIITRASCISPICVTFTVTEDPLDQISSTVYPVYDILDNFPSSTSTLKPVFIDCNENVKIEWNAFTNIYEIFVEGYKIGFTYISSGISNQWVILPNPVFDSLVSIETISGECPILPPPPVG
jgi:hypothetical protein